MSVPRAHRRFVDGAADRELAAEVARVLAKALGRPQAPLPEPLALVV